MAIVIELERNEHTIASVRKKREGGRCSEITL